VKPSAEAKLFSNTSATLNLLQLFTLSKRLFEKEETISLSKVRVYIADEQEWNKLTQLTKGVNLDTAMTIFVHEDRSAELVVRARVYTELSYGLGEGKHVLPIFLMLSFIHEFYHYKLDKWKNGTDDAWEHFIDCKTKQLFCKVIKIFLNEKKKLTQQNDLRHRLILPYGCE
jgi:hypothetical protein